MVGTVDGACPGSSRALSQTAHNAARLTRRSATTATTSDPKHGFAGREPCFQLAPGDVFAKKRRKRSPLVRHYTCVKHRNALTSQRTVVMKYAGLLFLSLLTMACSAGGMPTEPTEPTNPTVQARSSLPVSLQLNRGQVPVEPAAPTPSGGDYPCDPEVPDCGVEHPICTTLVRPVGCTPPPCNIPFRCGEGVEQLPFLDAKQR